METTRQQLPAEAIDAYNLHIHGEIDLAHVHGSRQQGLLP